MTWEERTTNTYHPNTIPVNYTCTNWNILRENCRNTFHYLEHSSNGSLWLCYWYFLIGTKGFLFLLEQRSAVKSPARYRCTLLEKSVCRIAQRGENDTVTRGSKERVLKKYHHQMKRCSSWAVAPLLQKAGFE